MTYNVPKGAGGSEAQQYRWHNMMTCMFNATPKGATITVSMYSWAHETSANALRRADRRGVIVRVVMWKSRVNAITSIFNKEFNDGKTKNSFFKLCTGACLGPNMGPRFPNIHHSKIVTISKFNSPRGPVYNTSNLGSGNFSYSNGHASFNTWRNYPNDQKLFTGLNSYILKQRFDLPSLPKSAQVIQSGATKVYLFPQANMYEDFQLDLLKNTTCYKGTRILMAQYTWSDGRLRIAQEVALKKRQGCSVTVLVNYDSALIGQDVMKTLLASKVSVRNAHVKGVHTHGKDLIISGPKRHVVSTGSANLTRGSTYANDESHMVINSRDVTNAHVKLFDTLWIPKSKPIPSAFSAKGTPEFKIPTTNDPALEEE
jgi:phosphatidylserine/phosphatidylglycerophosphate/cardiolipin synthase-like enzyme